MQIKSIRRVALPLAALTVALATSAVMAREPFTKE